MQAIPVVTPIIHLNGDRKATLLDALETAYDAVQAAEDTLRQCAPNGRNYYLEPGRYEQALAQHRARQEALAVVRTSLEAECIQIQDENPTR